MYGGRALADKMLGHGQSPLLLFLILGDLIERFLTVFDVFAGEPKRLGDVLFRLSEGNPLPLAFLGGSACLGSGLGGFPMGDCQFLA